MPTGGQHHRQAPQQPPAVAIGHQPQATEVDLRVQARRRIVEPHRDAAPIWKPQFVTANRCKLLYGTRTPCAPAGLHLRQPQAPLLAREGVSQARMRSRCGASSCSLSPGTAIASDTAGARHRARELLRDRQLPAATRAPRLASRIRPIVLRACPVTRSTSERDSPRPTRSSTTLISNMATSRYATAAPPQLECAHDGRRSHDLGQAREKTAPRTGSSSREKVM
jgi:hypothetical protein